MKKPIIIIVLMLFLNGCGITSSLMDASNRSFQEVIVSSFDFGEELYQRLTTSGLVVSNLDEVTWGEASRLIVIYDSTLMELYPPSFFGINITLEQGIVYNVVIDGQFITLIYPLIQHDLSALANETTDELFIKEGYLLIEDFFIKSGTLVLLDTNTQQHAAMFRGKSESFTTTTINSDFRFNNHFRYNRFDTIVFLYQENAPDALMEMQPSKLPRPNHVLEFENEKGQRIIMFHGNEGFMEPMINNFIEEWGETYIVERPIFNRDPLLDSQSHLNYQLPPNVCRISNAVQNNVLSGFPLDQLRVPTIGNIRAKVVYLDFLDYLQNPNGPSLEEQYRPLGDDVNRFIEFASYGKNTFEWDIHPKPLLMPKNVREYNLTRSGDRPGYYPTLEIVYEMLELYRDEVDFAGAEVIVVVFNQSIPFDLADVSPAHPVGLYRPFVTNQGNLFNAVTIASDWSDHKWQVIVHELAHTMGLIDLYDYGPVDNWNDHHRHIGDFDIMGKLSGDNLEFLGWNRYLMNWVDDDQVFCIDPLAESIAIPIQTIGLPVEHEEQLQMIVIPISRYKVLVIEAKQVNPYCKICDGLIVYTVDTTIASGRGSIKVIPIDRSTHVFKNDAMIRVGETLIAYGIEISLLSASPDGYVVELNKLSG